jgi:hypothetical protein
MASGALVGLIASPVIGVVVGGIAARARPRGRLQQTVVAIVDLYIAVTLFLVVVGLWYFAAGGAVTSLPRRLGAGPTSLVHSVLSGLAVFTFSGWILLLLPMSLVNHLALWVVGRKGDPVS